MCGIAGYAALDPRRPLAEGPVHAMLACVAHRGPDDEGAFKSPGIVLGHRRLSVIRRPCWRVNAFEQHRACPNYNKLAASPRRRVKP
jgi:hypothetical protein